MKAILKKILLIFAIIVGVILLAGVVLVAIYFLAPKSDAKYVAHQGYRSAYLGNTEPAFVAAAERGFYGIETDVHKTKDGVFICNHDDTVKYADGDEKTVSETTFAELLSKPLKNDKSDEEIYLCSFERYLEICKSGGKVAVIELKEDFSSEDLLLILAEVDRVYDREHVSVISFYFDPLVRVKEIDPDVDLQYLSESEDDPYFDRCLEEKISIDVRQSILTIRMVKRFHKAGLTVNTWTVNKDFDHNFVRLKGVDYITTDVFCEE